VLQLNQTAGHLLRPAAAAGGRPHADECCRAGKATALPAWLHEAAAARPGEPVQVHEWRERGRPSRLATCGSPSGTCASDDRAAAPQLLLVASDVTEQRAAEQARLQAAIAQREVLVREVHHRIKNNLQGVAGLLQQNAERHPGVADVLTEAVSQVQAIAQVYGLQVGRAGRCAWRGCCRPSRVGAAHLRPQHPSSFTSGEAAAMVLPEAESIPIALTVNELLTNAIKHGQGGEVRCAERGRRSCVAIANRPAAAGLRPRRGPGGVSGLGLVRALLPRRSATLTLDAAGRRGRGPRDCCAAQRAPAGRPILPQSRAMKAAACPSKGRILVVDDDRLVLATVVHGLVQAGYEVIDADNGDDAILLAREHRPELALLDIRMEGKSGFDVAEYLRDACRIPFMFLSAFSDEATIAQVQALGAWPTWSSRWTWGRSCRPSRPPLRGSAWRRPPARRRGRPAAASPAAPMRWPTPCRWPWAC
jgi:two-component sensor histidine kinase/CheY-like chemotaxis protein